MDRGHELTDELLDRLTAEMDKVYSQALKEMLAKQEKYMAAYEKELAKKKADLEAGKIKREEFEAWQRRQLIGAEWHKQMAKSLADDLTSVDKKALAASGQYIKDAYALNHDFGTFQVESGGTVDTSYTLYDRDTVERLIAERPNLLPKPSIDTKKDKRWNQQHFTSAITQSILQGESIPQAAARLRQVVGMGRNSAARAARTAITGAENAGRIESYKRAKALGIGMKKEWLATLDKRTRDTHARLDGEKVDVEDRFSNGLKYPGDPSGVAVEVYNCRCTLVPALDGIDQSGAPRDSKLGDMSYEEWRDRRATKAMGGHIMGGRELSIPEIMEVLGRFDASSVLEGFRDDEGDLVGKALAEATGAAGRPRTARSVSELGEDFIITYRGFGGGGGKFADQFVDGDYWCGQGISGCGSYTAIDASTALKYADDDKDSVVAVGIPRDARIIDKDDLRSMVRADKSFSGDAADILTDDIGRWGVAHGYDVIRVPRAKGDFYVVLNRSIVTVVRRPEV